MKESCYLIRQEHFGLKLKNKFFSGYIVFVESHRTIWDKVFKNGPSEICGRQPLKKQTISLQIFQKLSATNFTWSLLNTLSRLVL